MPAHVLSQFGPDGQKDALALVVAGSVLVGFAEVSRLYRSVDGADDLAERDVVRRSGQDVAATHASLGTNQARPLEGEQDLLEIGLRQTGALGYVPDRCRLGLPGMQRQGEQSSAGVVAPGGNLH